MSNKSTPEHRIGQAYGFSIVSDERKRLAETIRMDNGPEFIAGKLGEWWEKS